MVSAARRTRGSSSWFVCLVVSATLGTHEAAGQDAGTPGAASPPGAPTLITQSTPGADDTAAAHPDRSRSRVRPSGEAARRLLEQAIAESPSGAAMIDTLERSDLLVYVETRTLPKLVHGYVQMAGSTPEARYLRLVLGVPNSDRDLLAVLGHELRHTLEIAAMPDVRDAGSLTSKYRQLGVPVVKGGYYETDAALEAGRQVAREIALARRKAPFPGGGY